MKGEEVAVGGPAAGRGGHTPAGPSALPPDIRGLLPAELEAALASLGAERYRARQVLDWIYRRGARTFAAMTDLPAPLRERLAEAFRLDWPAVRARQEARDGTTKLLLEYADGERVETVLMRYRYGATACLSTQVGCRMGCAFCASTIGGLARDLSAAEMMTQVLCFVHEGTPPTRLVLMGIGEPLDNYDQTLRFLRIAAAPATLGISPRRLTVSTSGLAPQIRRLAREGLPVTLAVSLHAPSDALRTRLMPVNRLHPLDELLDACREYRRLTGRRVTFEYLLIAGLNDAPEHAAELAGRLAGTDAHVNLIPMNPVAERGLRPPDRRRAEGFRAALQERGVAATIRRALGLEIEAACGQLRRRHTAGGR